MIVPKRKWEHIRLPETLKFLNKYELKGSNNVGCSNFELNSAWLQS